jgi:ABC-type antimicrobial peptide transport system permease subunit
MGGGGVITGVPIAYWGKRFAASLMLGLPMFGVFPVISGVIPMLALVPLAAYLPARRATKVDSIAALKYE